MNSKIVLAALSFAIALSSAPVAMAGGKKAPAPADPRINLISLQKKSPGGWQTTCDIDPNCNGWAKWLAQQSGHKG
jgi:hypothetical protein